MTRQRHLKRAATTRQREAMKGILARQREREAAEVPPASPSPMRCRVCGCTDERACAGGCSWAGPELCTACVGKREGPLTPAERALLTHVTLFGSDGYPVQRVGKSWQWVDAFGVGGAPTVYPTKRKAVEAFEGWLDAMRAKLAEHARRCVDG